MKRVLQRGRERMPNVVMIAAAGASGDDVCGLLSPSLPSLSQLSHPHNCQPYTLGVTAADMAL